MNSFVKILLLLLGASPLSQATAAKLVREFPLDEHNVYSIPIGGDRVTTVSFPGPISAIDAANVTTDGKTPGLFQLAHTKGSYFFSVRALKKKAVTNINVRWNRKTYAIELSESDEPFYSVIFQYSTEKPSRPSTVQVTPGRLLGLLDKAKAYPLLKLHHPETVVQVEYLNYPDPKLMDYKDYEVQIDEVFRFNPEDTLIFRVLLRNKTEEVIHYPSDGFSLRVGERTYFQSASDASGTMPPKSETPAYFAITGTPNGGRNDLSLKNEFTVILDRLPASSKKSKLSSKQQRSQ